MADLHEVVFQWPHTEPTTVIVTGTFDQWSSTMQLAKGPAGFTGSTKIPWDKKIAYKFVVDEQWMVVEDKPTELDPVGNLNNVYTAPPQPPSPTPEPNSAVSCPGGYDPASGHEHVIGYDPTSGNDDEIADTRAARRSITSAFKYVASGLGAAIQSVVGIDPINGEQITPSPNPDASSSAPQEEASTSAPETESTPDVSVVPADVAEDNTSVTDPVVHPISPPAASTENTADPIAEEPSIHAIVSTEPEMSADGEAAGVPDVAHVPTVDEPEVVTTPVLTSSSEPAVEAIKTPDSEPPVTFSEAEVAAVVSANGTSAPKLDSTPQTQIAEDAATPHGMVDETMSHVEPASSAPMDVKTENVEDGKPAVEAVVSQPTNGHSQEPAAAAATTTTSSPPTTPTQKSHHRFPSSSSSTSPAKSFTSKVGAESRKKKTSIFGKVKHLFAHDKDKEKGKEKK